MNSEQQKYIALCDDVIRQARRIAAKCANSGAYNLSDLAAVVQPHTAEQ